jgi:hypothetical protein
MKYLVLLLGLINVVLVLWEVRNNPFLTPPPVVNNQLATILLVDETQRAGRGSIISGAIDRSVDDWQHSQTAAKLTVSVPNPNSVGDEVKRLLLANAIPVTPTTTADPAPAEIKPEPMPKMSCYEAGPFNNETELMQWLNSKALKNLETIYQENEVPADYQVYFPAAKNSEQLRINKMMLNAKGIADMWMVPSGADKGALSLGVFADHQRANAFRNELLEKGIKAEVKQRFKPVQQYYAKVKLDKYLQAELINNAESMLAPCRL